MKKLESIKMKKFENDKISSLNKISGGAPIQTYSYTSTTFFSYLTGSYVTQSDYRVADSVNSTN